MDVLPPLPLDVYLVQEFQAMDDGNRGYLDTKQFCDLLLFLGYDQCPEVVRMKMKEVDTDGDAIIRQTDYVEAMKEDKEFLEGTSILRDLFKKFDKDNSGNAFKTDVIQDLKEMGIYSPEMAVKVDAMDSNNDGQISYKDFLKVYFQGKK